MKRLLSLLFFMLLASKTYSISHHELHKKKFNQLAQLIHDIKNNSSHTQKNESQKLSLTLRMTAIGKRLLHSFNTLSQGRTGFKSLDTLNDQVGAHIVAYEHDCLLLECTHCLPHKDAHLIADAYNNLPGTGKFWNIEDHKSNYQQKKHPKKILVQLTSQASHDFILDQAQIHCEDGIKESGIESLDILNHNYEGIIIDTLRMGKRKNVGLTIEFAHPISNAILDEYRNLQEVAKVESILV